MRGGRGPLSVLESRDAPLDFSNSERSVSSSAATAFFSVISSSHWPRHRVIACGLGDAGCEIWDLGSRDEPLKRVIAWPISCCSFVFDAISNSSRSVCWRCAV